MSVLRFFLHRTLQRKRQVQKSVRLALNSNNDSQSPLKFRVEDEIFKRDDKNKTCRKEVSCGTDDI